MPITAKQVAQLRQMSSAGMMDCKKALEEANGDLQAAMDLLKKRKQAIVEKRAGRTAGQGAVGAVVKDGVGVLVEVLCETDFVARNEGFQSLIGDLCSQVAVNDTPDGEALKAQAHWAHSPRTVAEVLTEQAGSIGEKIEVGRVHRFAGGDRAVLDAYRHGEGRIGVLVELQTGKPESAASPEVAALAHDIALQVAAMNPSAIRREDLDPDVVTRERDVYLEQARATGKPEAAVEKIADGMMKKNFFQQRVLLEQPFVKDDSVTIRDLLVRGGEALGDTLEIARIARVQVGE